MRDHLAVLSDGSLLDLISLANTAPITNSDARELLKLTRNGAWRWLSKLVELGLLEKRGQAYRTSPYAKSLVKALSITYRSIVSGRPPQTENPAWLSLLKMAREGLEVLHARGRIERPDYDAKVKLLEKIEAEMNVKGD